MRERERERESARRGLGWGERAREMGGGEREREREGGGGERETEKLPFHKTRVSVQHSYPWVKECLFLTRLLVHREFERQCHIKTHNSITKPYSTVNRNIVMQVMQQ